MEISNGLTGVKAAGEAGGEDRGGGVAGVSLGCSCVGSTTGHVSGTGTDVGPRSGGGK